MKYAWLDKVELPWQLKSIWAHHHYLLGRVPGALEAPARPPAKT